VPREVIGIKLALTVFSEAALFVRMASIRVSRRPQVVCVAIDYQKFNRFLILALAHLLPVAAAFGPIT
jgi:hypothetical protein